MLGNQSRSAASSPSPLACAPARRRPRRDVWDEYRKEETLGSGAYGQVFRAQRNSDGTIVAVKRCSKDPHESITATTLREISALRKVDLVCKAGERFPFVVQLYDTFADAMHVYLVMEFCETDLSKLIKTAPRRMSSGFIKIVTFQILCGVSFLEDYMIMHRDLKPANILIQDIPGFGVCVKIADFGLSRAQSYPSIPYSPTVQTLMYRAPELLFQKPATDYRNIELKKYNHLADVWSVGCILAEMIGRQVLFNKQTELDLCTEIVKTLGLPNATDFDFVPSDLGRFTCGKDPQLSLESRFPNFFRAEPAALQLLKRMLEINPKKRVRVIEAVKSPFFLDQAGQDTIREMHKENVVYVKMMLDIPVL
ncbi:kinase-like domain-containing protein [Chytriomyces sp. MP71]|nr:kinase-like domain-containing protein [Chytriomyces sp. MP71]